MARKLYPASMVYHIASEDFRRLGKLPDRQDIRAIATGEHRPPKAGEWYLSGAVVEAYHAPNDLGTAYHIAKLVRVEVRVVAEVVADV